MTETQAAMIDAVKIAAGLEAQRIAVATLNQLIAQKLIPHHNYKIAINVEVEAQIIAQLPEGARLAS